MKKNNEKNNKIQNDTIECGTIVFERQSKEFMAVCLICNRKFFELFGFSVHIRQEHNEKLHERPQESDVYMKLKKILNDTLIQIQNESLIKDKSTLPKIQSSKFGEKNLELNLLGKKHDKKQPPNFCEVIEKMHNKRTIGQYVKKAKDPLTDDFLYIPSIPKGYWCCDKCKKIYSYAPKNCLQYQQQVESNTGICGTCKKKSVEEHLKNHILIQQWQCIGCKRNFFSKSHLKKHQLSCVYMKKLLKCEKCKEKFFNRKHLTTHSLTHEAKFKCNFCGMTFINIDAVKFHRKKHLKGHFKCDICLKRFHWKKQLIDHLQTHEIKFKCHFCDIIY